MQTLELLGQGVGWTLLDNPTEVHQREAAIRLQLARWSAETGQADKDAIKGGPPSAPVVRAGQTRALPQTGAESYCRACCWRSAC